MDARERLVEATRDVLWERGYSATSPRDIMARANAGQGSLYHHFSGKSDLASTALRRTGVDLRAATEEVLRANSSPTQAILAYLERPRDRLKGCPLGRMTYDPAVLADAQMRAPVAETLEWYQERIEELLTEAQRIGELRSDFSAAAVATALVAIVQGAWILARAAQSEATFDRSIEGGVLLLQSLST